MEREPQEWVDVPGGRLWTVSSGAGVPLVLCHGGPGSYDYLGPVAEVVHDMARVHRFDQRGGGRSRADGPWTITALLDDMECLRRHWRHERWVVGGHSWGAHLALFYALAHPERTLGLVFLSGTGVRWGWGPDRRARRMRRLTAGERAEVERLEAELARAAEEATRSRLRELWWLADFADRRNALRSPRFTEYPTNPAVVAALEQEWRRGLVAIDDKIRGLDAPVLVLHGDADPIDARGPREVSRLAPRGRFVSLRGVGHVPWLEDAGELRYELRMFLDRVASEPDQVGPVEGKIVRP